MSYGFNVLFPLKWLLSGILVNPHSVPSPYKEYLGYNPGSIAFECIRYSYFEGYPDAMLNVPYVFWTATCLLALGLNVACAE
jgi:capsular polysaccharide transport system permease protein